MKKHSITKENERNDHMDYLKSAASETDCTGVVYTGMLTDEELDNLNDIYPFEPEPADVPHKPRRV